MTLKEGRQGQPAESVHTRQLPCRPALHTIEIQAADYRLWATIAAQGICHTKATQLLRVPTPACRCAGRPWLLSCI